MPRNPRLDTPGSWHHVMNRGIARRSVFEGSADIRVFLACLARECRRGAIELHAYSILTTHFHLLIRSPRGELSLAMQRAQNRYVRYFNRSRRRDGPLFRGRFRSKPIDSLEYRKCVLIYIDANPVEAGIVWRSQDYPFGSRCRYEEAVGPPWLMRAWVESAIQSAARRGAVPPSYEMVFPLDLQREPFELVERRLMSKCREPDPLDDLVGAAPAKVREWMQRKARLADGTTVGLPICSPSVVQHVIREASADSRSWSVSVSRKPLNGWGLLEVGLLLDLCGLSLSAVASMLGSGTSTIGDRARQHRRLLLVDCAYADRAARMTSASLPQSLQGRLLRGR